LAILFLTIGLLRGAPVAAADAGPSLLSHRLALIREGHIFLEVEEDAIAIYVAGWKVKEFPVSAHQIAIGDRSEVTSVADVIPLNPPRRIVLDSAVLAEEAQDTSADVSSLDQIIGVDDMPEIYLVKFDDGTVWMVNFEGWQGLAKAWKKSRLQWQTLLDATGGLFHKGIVRARFLEMPPDTARELYWVLEKEMKVLQ
jgi:hypothetical protein